MRRDEDYTALVGQHVQLVVTECSGRKIVGSINKVTAEQNKAKREEFWANVEVGKSYTGVVKSLTSYGAFVDIGGVDGLCHISEQYFSGTDDNTSDYLSEGLMQSLIHSSRIAIQNPEDYEARSNIMWTATWALNTLVAQGKSTDWMVHMLGQAVGAYTDATHGMTLSAVSLPYYRFLLPYGLEKFRRFAVNVWAVDPAGKTDEDVAREGLARMEAWMKELGLVMGIRELGVTEEMLEGISKSTLVMEGGYKVLTRAEILDILKASL